MSRVIKKCCYALRKNYVDEFIVSYPPVQKQTSGCNCGLFDIAFAADILDGKCSSLSIFIMLIPAGLYSRFFVFVILFLFVAIVYNRIRFRMQWKLTSHAKLKIMHLEQDSFKNPIESTVLVKGLVIALPYLDKMSLQIRARINRIMKNKLPYCNPGFALQIKYKVSSFFILKDRILSILCSGIVYKFQSGDCNAACYGKAKRHFKFRICEHLRVSALTGKKS